MSEAISGKLVISICAGVTLSQLRSWVPKDTEVVRAMPNTPCKVSPPCTGMPVSETLAIESQSPADLTVRSAKA